MTNTMDENANAPEQPVDPWFLAEFAAWTMAALAPLLTWVNGPAVSTDQYVVRTAVFVLALAAAIAMRIGKIVRKWRGLARAACCPCAGEAPAEKPPVAPDEAGEGGSDGDTLVSKGKR